MRYVLAIAALVISGALLTLGFGQRTFLAGPAEISYQLETRSDAGYAMIEGSEFAKVPGQANVVVDGPNGFVATGATSDIEMWLEPFDHDRVAVDGAEQRLAGTPVAGVRPEANAATGAEADAALPAALDPRGSDLWLEERSASGGDSGAAPLRVPVAPGEGQSVIIASDGETPVADEIALVWVQDRETPWAGPLLAGGALFAVVGGVLYLLAIDHNHRGLGPRRGRRGPLQGIRNIGAGRRGRRAAAKESGAVVDPGAAESGSPESGAARRSPLRRGAAVSALGLSVALGLSGCSADYWPQFDAAPTEESVEGKPSSPSAAPTVPVPVTDAQLSRIVKRIAATAGEADDELDADLLEERFMGDALRQRIASYQLREGLSGDRALPPRLTDRELDYELVQSTESWPRTVFVTVESETGGETAKPSDDEAEEDAADAAEQTEKSASPSLALVLKQATPQENYRVSKVIALRGGISMPAAAPAEEGTALLANDIESLTLPPGQVGEAFAAVLQNGIEAPEAAYFDLAEDDSMLANYGKALAERAQEQAEDRGETMVATSEVRQGESPAVALSTGVGGALVATTIIDDQISDADGGRFKPKAEKAVTVLSGLEGEQERIVQEVAHQVLFYVPSKDSGEKIQLLGVTSELVGARN